MTRQQKILNTISAIRGIHPDMEEICLYGSCMNLFVVLRSIYPDSEAYFNVDHVITKIDGRYYDITGQVSGAGYAPFASFYNKRRTSRSFTLMMKCKWEKPMLR